jgi:hypothetical protein
VTASTPFARQDLVEVLLGRTRQGPPLLLAGPPGAGKTWLLQALGDALEAAGWEPVYLDLMGAASSPERFVATAGTAIPARTVPRSPSHAEWVQAVFTGWATLRERGGRPVALLLDEATEIRSLAYFAGLREVHQPFGAALAARPRGTVLATSFPSQARRLWPHLAVTDVPPLTPEELGAARPDVDPGTLLAATGGWPRYVRGLLEEIGDGRDLEAAWVNGMAAGGRLETACRHTYETLLLRSRGYGMSKAVLAVVAEEEGLNLTALVGRLGRTPGAIRDYLGWLLAVDALRMVRKRYYYVDPLLRTWVRLHARGRVPSVDDVRQAASALFSSAAADAPERNAPAAPSRHEGLMEID